MQVAGWGNFLEKATLVAGGPGIAFLYDGPNMGLDFSYGIGRAFNTFKNESSDDFAETMLAINMSIGKFWWLSGNTNLGVSLLLGIHGLTVTTGQFSSVGCDVGLGIAFLFG